MYCFSEGIMFFFHNKSVNGSFSHDFSAKRTGPYAANAWMMNEKIRYNIIVDGERENQIQYYRSHPVSNWAPA